MAGEDWADVRGSGGKGALAHVAAAFGWEACARGCAVEGGAEEEARGGYCEWGEGGGVVGCGEALVREALRGVEIEVGVD